MQLQPHPTIPPPDGPVLVCILDGFGENEVKDEYNAVHAASTPVCDKLREVPGRWRTIKVRGERVEVGRRRAREMPPTKREAADALAAAPRHPPRPGARALPAACLAREQ